MKERRIEFVASDPSSEGLQPTDRAFDFPSPAVGVELASVLRGRSNTTSAVRTEEFDIAIGKSLSKRGAVGCPVVKELIRNVGGDRRVGQRFDPVHLGMMGRLDVNRQRQSIAVGEDQDLGSFATTGLADAIAPFFAEANVPSAKDSVS